MNEQVSVAFRTLGCKVNRVESEDMAAELLGRGIALVEESSASVVVINTCTVTGEADAKARKAVRQALRLPLKPVVVVTGCLATVDAQSLRELDERVVVEAEKSLVPAMVADALGLDSHDHGERSAVRVGGGFRTRVPLKVQDGCDSFCSYCIVPFARGVPRSEPVELVVDRARELVASGAREIVLTGINLGRYDSEGVDLAGLVEHLADTGVARLRLSSVEPMDLSERLLSVLAATPAVCAHLHVPLQSGSDRVLASMNRGYSVEQYRGRVTATREALPGVAVTTDVIVGFPGETEHDAEQTLALCSELELSGLHVFRYSRRPGTPAADMGQVPPVVRNERAARARELGVELKSSFARFQVGRTAEVLVERIGQAGEPEGVTREYLRVRLSAEVRALPGDLVPVVIGEMDGEIARGMAVTG